MALAGVIILLAGCVWAPPDSKVEPGFHTANKIAGRMRDLPADAPEIVARSAIMIDAVTGKTLYEKNADIPMPVASTQKLLTAMEAIAEGELDSEVEISFWDELQPPTKLGLTAGTHYRKIDLLGAMLVGSANDAAHAVSHSTLGTGDFIARMNSRARRMGASRSRFLNPHGLDEPGQHSTARDSAIIAYHAYRTPLIRYFAATCTLPFDRRDGTVEIVENTNQLLWNKPPYFNGLKSGFTLEGGKCLVASAKHDGHESIIVLLASTPDEVFHDAKKLFLWHEKKRQQR